MRQQRGRYPAGVCCDVRQTSNTVWCTWYTGTLQFTSDAKTSIVIATSRCTIEGQRCEEEREKERDWKKKLVPSSCAGRLGESARRFGVAGQRGYTTGSDYFSYNLLLDYRLVPVSLQRTYCQLINALISVDVIVYLKC